MDVRLVNVNENKLVINSLAKLKIHFSVLGFPGLGYVASLVSN
jgi:hypothetical protein